MDDAQRSRGEEGKGESVPYDCLSLAGADWDTAMGWAADYVRQEALEAPLTEPDIRRHALDFVALHAPMAELGTKAGSVAAVLLHNALWIPRVRAVPLTRRVLLLPQCLRAEQACPAQRDAAGWLCERCGACSVGRLVELADSLGMATLVTEGATLVRQLIATGKIDAVIGVGCLESLEQLFPEMMTFGVPGLAVPLRRSGCRGTEVEEPWIRRLIQVGEGREDWGSPILMDRVRSWFSQEELERFWGGGSWRSVERLALDVLLQEGKRWRPYLTAALYETLAGRAGGREEERLRRTAVAVECFHKASLVHDDIEDGDRERYGKPALHATQGVAVAINVGDFLIGAGYRWLAEASRGLDPETGNAMLSVAACAHRRLCLGQGDELAWVARRSRLRVEDTLLLMTDKTSPAFDVALQLGAFLAGADPALCRALQEFSQAFGLAYQIQDDLADFRSGSDLLIWRPNLVLSVLGEAASPASMDAVEAWLRLQEPEVRSIHRMAEDCGALARTEALLARQTLRVRETVRVVPDARVAKLLGEIVDLVL